MKVQRRVIVRLLSLLLAGAIINVAVAWGCAISLSPGMMSDAIAESEDDVCKRLASRYGQTDWGSRCFGAGVCSRFGFERLRAIYIAGPDAPGGLFQAAIEECTVGWPSGCLRGGSVLMGNGEFSTRHCLVLKPGSWTRVTELPRGDDFATQSANAIPFGLLWPGFAINTIFYAAVLWVLFSAPLAVRRHMRIKRGQCASCGYSLRGIESNACPECGATA